MDFFWTDEADSQFRKYKGDAAVQNTFRDLVMLISERPSAGWRIDECVTRLDDPVARRIAHAVSEQPLPHPARIVAATIPGPRGASPPPWLAIVIHLEGAPAGVNAQHTLLTMGTISRQSQSKFK